MKRSLLISTLSVLFIVACSGPHYFLAPDFNSKTAGHKNVAIIPFEMIFTGKKPEKLTADDIKKIEEGESQAFQMSLYNNLLRYSRTKNGTIMITFQPYEKTNQILKDAGLSVRDVWSTDPQKLASILGVDAVVKSRVQKNRYMSDLAAYGIDLGYSVIQAIGLEFGGALLYALVGPPKTNDIDSQCTLFNGADGSVLWKDMYKASASWNAPANEVIENLNSNFARHFPYRVKEKKK